MVWKYLISLWELRGRGQNLNPKGGDFLETFVKDDLREGEGERTFLTEVTAHAKIKVVSL